MQKLKSLIGLALMALALTMPTGCALFQGDATTAQKANDVRNLSYAAASIGTSVALMQNPAYRPAFELAEFNLDVLITSKTITGAQLRAIFLTLPVKELKSDTARIVIESATVLYDASIGDKVNIENNAYVLAAATGIRDGIKTGLGSK